MKYKLPTVAKITKRKTGKQASKKNGGNESERAAVMPLSFFCIGSKLNWPPTPTHITLGSAGWSHYACGVDFVSFYALISCNSPDETNHNLIFTKGNKIRRVGMKCARAGALRIHTNVNPFKWIVDCGPTSTEMSTWNPLLNVRYCISFAMAAVSCVRCALCACNDCAKRFNDECVCAQIDMFSRYGRSSLSSSL